MAQFYQIIPFILRPQVRISLQLNRHFNKNYNENLPVYRYKLDLPYKLKEESLNSLEKCQGTRQCDKIIPERMDNWMLRRYGPKQSKPLPPIFPLTSIIRAFRNEPLARDY